MDKIKEIKNQIRQKQSDRIKSIRSTNKFSYLKFGLKKRNIILNNNVLKDLRIKHPIILKKIYDKYKKN